MKILYSKSTGGFYSREIHGDNIPVDVVEITNEEHKTLIDGQSEGKTIVANADGHPILQDRVGPTAEETIAIITANREAAYKSEADPLFFKYQRGEVKKADWLNKIAEIKLRFKKD